MSRADKRYYQENLLEQDPNAIHLYAFSNTRPFFKPTFSPPSPLIIFKTKFNKEEQQQWARGGEGYHPCKGWSEMAELLFQWYPNDTPPVFLLDIAERLHQTPQPLEAEEQQLRAGALGEVLKQTSNIVSKLNPKEASVVAVAGSCYLALKFVLVGEKIYGHGDHRYVHQLLLVSPTDLATLRELTESAKGLRRTADEEKYPKPRVVVLLAEGSEPKYREEVQAWLSDGEGALWVSSEVRCYNNNNAADPTTSLFYTIADLLGLPYREPCVESEVDVHTRFPKKRVYRVDFVLSKQTKNVEQIASPYPLAGEDDGDDGDDGSEYEEEEEEEVEEGEVEKKETTTATTGPAHGEDCGCGGDHHHHHHNQETQDGEEGEEEGVVPMLVSGIASLLHIKDSATVLVEGRWLDADSGTVATTEGCVHVEGLRELLGEKERKVGTAITFSAFVAREVHGRTFLEATEARVMKKKEIQNSFTVGERLEELPLHYNVSLLAHRVGAVLIRGRKCALVRGMDLPSTANTATSNNNNKSDTVLSIPHIPHDESGETAVECAMRALCEALDVSSDNFYFPQYISPVEFYIPPSKKDSKDLPTVVTVYVALAVQPPPQGPRSDAVEDAPEPEEPYDWVSYPRALDVNPLEEEREVLREIQKKLAKAAAVRLYLPVEGCGQFGDPVKASK